MKLNTDGSRKDPDKAPRGAVIRRDNWRWYIGISKKFPVSTPLAAELITLREGLILAKDYNISHLEVETDAHALKIMLSNSKDFINHELGVLLKDVVTLLGHPWIMIFNHAYLTRGQQSRTYTSSFSTRYENSYKKSFRCPYGSFHCL